MWLDEGELDSLDGSVWTNAEALDGSEARSAAKRSCPKCETAMAAIKLEDASNLVVDRCEGCRGYWLDEIELSRIKSISAEQDAAQSHPTP